jgi:rhodanese-related sulfurtransferase
MEMNPALILLVVVVVAYVASKRIRSKLALGKVQKLVAAGVEVLFLDVRTQAEHLERRIADSINVPLDQLHSGLARVAPDKSAPLAVYCLSGSRAASAMGILKGLGYTNPINIGAISSWPGEFASGKPQKRRKA